MSPAAKARFRRLRARAAHAVLRALAPPLGRLSLPAVQRVGRLFGRLGWWFGRRDRRRALEHLALAFPERPAAERRALARAAFRHQGMNLAEDLHLLSRGCADVARYVETEGWERVAALRAAGTGVLIVTGHCGNWELLAAAINCRGLGMRVVARALDEPELQDLLVAFRRRFGSESIERGRPGAARELLRALREGALGMLIDQDTRVEGVWVPFFGRPAYTPVGAAKVALRPGVAAVPAFVERRPDGTHLARFLPPLDLPPDETAATALMTQAIEAQIRRRPEQWVWMHRRWRRQPPG
jgi:KDO2-lipid IV(A) lauroyltransferase